MTRKFARLDPHLRLSLKLQAERVDTSLQEDGGGLIERGGRA